MCGSTNLGTETTVFRSYKFCRQNLNHCIQTVEEALQCMHEHLQNSLQEITICLFLGTLKIKSASKGTLCKLSFVAVKEKISFNGLSLQPGNGTLRLDCVSYLAQGIQILANTIVFFYEAFLSDTQNYFYSALRNPYFTMMIVNIWPEQNTMTSIPT